MRWLTVMAILLGMAAAAPAKDLVIRERHTGTRVTGTQEVTQYLGGKVRVSDSPRVRSIINLDAKTVTMIDKERKTYSTMTFDQLREQTQALERRVQGLPANLRSMIGDVSNVDETVTLKPTKNTEKIAGYSAKEYTIEAASMKGSVWITEALDVSSEGREWEDFAGTLSSGQGRQNKLGRAMANIKGLPLRTRVTNTVGNQEITTQTEAVEVKEGVPPPELLKVPEGFKRLTPPSPPPEKK